MPSVNASSSSPLLSSSSFPLLSSSSSLLSVGPQADERPGGLHIYVWYALSGLGALVLASKCGMESSFPDMPRALSRKADQRLSVIGVALLSPPGRKFLRWLGCLRPSPGQLRRRAEGIAGLANVVSRREPPPAEPHGPPEEQSTDEMWAQAADLYREAERRERETWGEYWGECRVEFWGGVKEGGESCRVCVGLCWLAVGEGVKELGRGVRGVGRGVRGVWRGVRGG